MAAMYSLGTLQLLCHAYTDMNFVPGCPFTVSRLRRYLVQVYFQISDAEKKQCYTPIA